MDTQTTPEVVEKKLPKIKNILSADQKKYTGLVLSATGLVFFLISIMLIITLLFATKFNVKILIELISSGHIFAGLAIGLLTTGIVSFAVGLGISNKE